MFTVTVKDHIMIAHSLKDPFFGQAEKMHGATYVVEVSFSSEKLNDKNVVLDIGEASRLLNAVLSELNYQNLDSLPQFKNQLTTTEFIAKYIYSEIKKSMKEKIKLKIVLHESHIASASYEDL